MRYGLPPGHPPLVAREGERWRSLDTPALVEALLAAGYYELPPTRAFALGRVKWDKRRTYINLAASGKIRIGGDAPGDAEELLALLASESEVRP
jgi:hypothetical protein